MQSTLLTTWPAYILFQIWNWQYILSGILSIILPIILIVYNDMNSRLTRLLVRTEPTLFYILTFFVNFLMHSGLRVPIPYTNGTELTLFPQFVPNTCAEMKELTGRRDTWPCHREAMLTWIRHFRKGEDAEFWDFASLVFVVVMFMFHIFALIWASGIFPNAEWRKSDWLPPSCANGKARREREEGECSTREVMAWSEKKNEGELETEPGELEKGSTRFDVEANETV